MSESTTQQIPLDKIVPSPFQARKDFNDEQLKELSESIKQHGLMNAINVRPVGDHFELIAGERRWRAAKLLGWQTIEAKVEQVDDKEAAERVMVENLQRQDLNPIEQAKGYKHLEAMGLTQDEIADKVGLSDRGSVSRAISLLELPEPVQQMLSQDNISETQIRYLGRIKEQDQMIKTAKQAADEGWSVKETEKRVNALLGKHPANGNGKEKAEKPDIGLHWSGEKLAISASFAPQQERPEDFLVRLKSAMDSFFAQSGKNLAKSGMEMQVLKETRAKVIAMKTGPRPLGSGPSHNDTETSSSEALALGPEPSELSLDALRVPETPEQIAKDNEAQKAMEDQMARDGIDVGGNSSPQATEEHPLVTHAKTAGKILSALLNR